MPRFIKLHNNTGEVLVNAALITTVVPLDPKEDPFNCQSCIALADNQGALAVKESLEYIEEQLN